MLNLSKEWLHLAQDTLAIGQLEKEILPPYLKNCRWFGSKARKLSGVSIAQILPVPSLLSEQEIFHLLILKVKYETGRSEEYLLPVALVLNKESVPEKGAIGNTNLGWLIDAIYDPAFRQTIFINLFNSSGISQKNGALIFEKGSSFKPEDFSEKISSRVLEADQSNSSLIYEEKYFLKIYRKLFREINPDVEVTRFLTEKAHFKNIPSFAGTIYWKKRYSALTTLGMMQEKVTAIKDAWSLAGDYLNEFLYALGESNAVISLSSVQQAALLGQRTGEMHLALGGDEGDPVFIPETFNNEYTKWLFNNCESLLKRRLRLTKDCYSSLDEAGKDLAKFFLGNQGKIREFFSEIRKKSFQSLRIRVHGDYHLGQVLFDGSDYVILDFEGEPESSIKDRKIKHSPLKDVAGMLRSFHYAVSAKLYFSPQAAQLSQEKIEAAVNTWYHEVTRAFLDSYWQTIVDSRLINAERSELDFLLQFHLLEKAVYELGYELNGRPAWVKIPLKGIAAVLQNA